MNSRQRIEAAVNFKTPDRLPIDLGGIRASGINAVVYHQLKKRMGIDTPTRIHDTMQILAHVELEVLDRLHADVVPLDVIDQPWHHPFVTGQQKKLFCGQDVFFHPDVKISQHTDGSWTLDDDDGKPFALMPKEGFYFDFIKTTMAGKPIDPSAFQPSDTVTDEQLQFITDRGRWLFDNTDKAILAWGAGISLLGLSFLLSDNITQGSLDNWLCMLMTEKQAAHDMMARSVDAAIKKTALYHQALGDIPFAWGVASDDAGTQKSELIHPDLFAEMIVPHYNRFCDWIHKNTNWKTFLHSCGSIYNYIGHWIDAGIDILNPVQISAANMSPENLMEKYRGKVVFWGGGCDTQHTLPLGTPEQIDQHVKHNIEIFNADATGYVFNQVHNIQQNVPVENVETMFAAAYKYGANPKTTR